MSSTESHVILLIVYVLEIFVERSWKEYEWNTTPSMSPTVNMWVFHVLSELSQIDPFDWCFRDIHFMRN